MWYWVSLILFPKSLVISFPTDCFGPCISCFILQSYNCFCSPGCLEKMPPVRDSLGWYLLQQPYKAGDALTVPELHSVSVHPGAHQLFSEQPAGTCEMFGEHSLVPGRWQPAERWDVSSDTGNHVILLLLIRSHTTKGPEQYRNSLYKQWKKA